MFIHQFALKMRNDPPAWFEARTLAQSCGHALLPSGWTVLSPMHTQFLLAPLYQ